MTTTATTKTTTVIILISTRFTGSNYTPRRWLFSSHHRTATADCVGASGDDTFPRAFNYHYYLQDFTIHSHSSHRIGHRTRTHSLLALFPSGLSCITITYQQPYWFSLPFCFGAPAIHPEPGRTGDDDIFMCALPEAVNSEDHSSFTSFKVGTAPTWPGTPHYQLQHHRIQRFTLPRLLRHPPAGSNHVRTSWARCGWLVLLQEGRLVAQNRTLAANTIDPSLERWQPSLTLGMKEGVHEIIVSVFMDLIGEIWNWRI